MVGLGEACAIAAERMEEDRRHLESLRWRLRQQLADLGGVFVNGGEPSVPHILNLAFAGVHGEALAEELQGRLAVSAGSACSSASGSPSHVLRALGRPDALAQSSMRFSFGRATTPEQIDEAARVVSEAVTRLRGFSPLWARHRSGATLEALYSAGFLGNAA